MERVFENERMRNQRPTVLLMTATIRPPINCPDLERRDPDVRLQDYATALRFYLSVPADFINRIVFVENSDSDLGSLKQIASGSHAKTVVDFVSFPGGNDYPPTYGKGYGEMLMIDYALKRSGLFSERDQIWKATGRLIAANIAKLIQTAPHDYDVYCDLHNACRWLPWDAFFDSRFFSFNLAGFQRHFMPHVPNLHCQTIEFYYYDFLKQASRRDQGVFPRFREQPIIKGFAGHHNSNYYSPSKQVQRLMQHILRKAAPWIWI